MKHKLLLLTISFLFFSFSSDVQKKILRIDDYDIECYVSLKKMTNYDCCKEYYWFKSGEIHNSKGSANGYILHDSYSKFYRSNQLAEKGKFHYGLKDGVWKNWHENGQLKSFVNWHKGVKKGQYLTFDYNGEIILKGNYKNDKKVGEWINEKTKDTTYYDNGAPQKVKQKGFIKRLFSKKAKKEKVKKDSFFKRLFGNKNKDSKNE